MKQPTPENMLICLMADTANGVQEVMLEDTTGRELLDVSDFYDELPRLKDGVQIYTVVKREEFGYLTHEKHDRYLVDKDVYEKIKAEYGIH